MAVHSLKLAEHVLPIVSHAEKPMLHAPRVQLANGNVGIPQHYMEYQQSLASLQEVVAQVSFSENMLIFVDEDASGLYLQVGIIGRENYERGNLIRPHKLVYGRKWRIETYTPSSEVIQTAFLALKKAREHEVRELFTLLDRATGKHSAAFSSHQDLPLMARNTDLFDGVEIVEKHDIAGISLYLEAIRVGQRAVHLIECTTLKNGSYILELQLGEATLARKLEGDMPELDQAHLTLVCKNLSRADVLHEIMDQLIQMSDRYVDEHFTYRGFARFSRKIDPFSIAKLSIASRPYARDKTNAVFSQVFLQTNGQVDALRAPAIGGGRLARINLAKLEKFSPLIGHMPKKQVSKENRLEA